MTKARARYHHGDLRRALLDASLDLIRTSGADALALRAVARKAGVSHSAPYHHFRSKAALVAAVAADGFRGLRESVLARMATQPDGSIAQFREGGVAYVLFAIEHPERYRVMFGVDRADPATYSELRDEVVATGDIAVRAIERCQRGGLLRAGDPRELANILWATCHGLSSLLIDGELRRGSDVAQAEKLARHLTKLVLTGVATERGSASLRLADVADPIVGDRGTGKHGASHTKRHRAQTPTEPVASDPSPEQALTAREKEVLLFAQRQRPRIADRPVSRLPFGERRSPRNNHD
jgi:AcrR family transcriptional regulator